MRSSARKPRSNHAVALALVTAVAAVAGGCRDGNKTVDATGTTIAVESHSQALTGVWTGVDIGGPLAGNNTVDGSNHTIQAGGADIYGTADQFRFVYMTVTGNVTITARITGLGATDPVAKAGLMMRENLTAGARNVFAALTPTALNKFRLQSRTAVNGTTARTNGPDSFIPGWLRLVRSGNTFSSFYSSDGTSWIAYATPVTVTLSATLEVGLAVTSHNPTQLTTAQFTNVTFNPAQTPPTPPGAPGSVTASPGHQQVTLGWGAVSGASSYTVKRSITSGSGYATVMSGLTSPGHTDTGLSNGTPYFYVITASNAAGEGPASTEVSATPTPPPAPGIPTGLTATAGNNQVSLTWAATATATSYTLKSGTQAGGPYPDVFANLTSPSFTHTGLSNGVPRYYVVSASNAGGTSGDSAQASATPTAPPVEAWTSKIIGTVASGATGSYSRNGTTHTLSAGGSDIYGTADNFRFAYMTISGDVTITARVQSLTNTNVWAKAVVMIRESDAAGARNVATVLSPTATNKYRQQLRSATNGSSTSVASAANSALPSWIRLQRVGNTITTSHSTNGTSWTQVTTPVTLTLPASALIGLGVASHTTTANTTATAVFTDVAVVVPAPPQAPTGLAAQPGNNQVHLTWNTVAGATGYTVKRGDSASGPFSVVASNLVEARFTNTGLTNGTPYHFVVAASNPAGGSGDSAVVSATPVLLRPSVRSVSPADDATDVATNAFVALDLIMPNVGGGVDASTLTSSTVFLQRASDNQPVAATLNTSGGADVVVLQPNSTLAPQTTYNFFLTDGLKDGTGAAFVPFSSSFTTGDAPPPPPEDVEFDKVTLSTATGFQFTSVTIGPDNRLYAATITGQIVRWTMNADGTLGAATVINTVRTNNGNADRAVIGITFDPAATSSNLILWITHGAAALQNAADWSGKLTRLSGATLGTYEDKVINFPRSAKDHMTNSIAFKAGEPNALYISQGSMNAMGAPDNAWSQRAEHLMAAAILRVDLTRLPGTGALNLQTNDADPTASGYNPFAANAAVTIYGPGVRNAYDLLWHSNGELYSATNGSAAGGNTPATPSPLPSACNRRIDGSPYTGPTVPAITGNPVAEDDYLYRVIQGGYYGHPNPSRCEWVLNGGNPTSGTDNTQVTAYPVGVQPDRNWRGNVFNFGAHYSPNGMIEWRSNVFPQLVGKMLVVRYSGGDDIIVLTVNPTTKGISGADTGIVGFTGFVDPLDLTHNVTTGHVYVTEYAASKITLLRPRL